MKESLQVKRTRCDRCKHSMTDTELHLNSPYILFGGMSPIQWQQNDLEGSRTDAVKIFMETQTQYLSQKEFCGAECLTAFMLDIAEKVGKHESLFKMNELKK